MVLTDGSRASLPANWFPVVLASTCCWVTVTMDARVASRPPREFQVGFRLVSAVGTPSSPASIRSFSDMLASPHVDASFPEEEFDYFLDLRHVESAVSRMFSATMRFSSDESFAYWVHWVALFLHRVAHGMSEPGRSASSLNPIFIFLATLRPDRHDEQDDTVRDVDLSPLIRSSGNNVWVLPGMRHVKLDWSKYGESGGGGYAAEMCAICMSNFLDDDDVLALCGGHTFHRDCAAKWLGEEATCPICRAKVANSLHRDGATNYL